MNPNDPRHGTVHGYQSFGCRCLPCATAKGRYEKRRGWLVHQGLNPTIPAHGFQRRVRALMRNGWTQSETADALGIARGNLAAKMRAKTVYRATHEAMCALYEQRCMILRDDPISRRSARIAERNGWPPPLAWINIDDPTENPAGWEYTPRKVGNQHADDLDPVVVQRLLEGDRVPSTAEERAEAMAVWVANGGSRKELARWHGWKPERYSRGLRVVRGGAA